MQTRTGHIGDIIRFGSFDEDKAVASETIDFILEDAGGMRVIVSGDNTNGAYFELSSDDTSRLLNAIMAKKIASHDPIVELRLPSGTPAVDVEGKKS